MDRQSSCSPPPPMNLAKPVGQPVPRLEHMKGIVGYLPACSSLEIPSNIVRLHCFLDFSSLSPSKDYTIRL